MGKQKICGINNCDGILNITYVKTRDNGDKVRTRTCSICKRLTHSIEVDVSKYDAMKELVDDILNAFMKFKKNK